MNLCQRHEVLEQYFHRRQTIPPRGPREWALRAQAGDVVVSTLNALILLSPSLFIRNLIVGRYLFTTKSLPASSASSPSNTPLSPHVPNSISSLLHNSINIPNMAIQGLPISKESNLNFALHCSSGGRKRGDIYNTRKCVYVETQKTCRSHYAG